MDFQVVWTDPALSDLREIVEYISRNDPLAAERVGSNIIDHVETLQTFPFIGPTYPRGHKGIAGKSFAAITAFSIVFRRLEIWLRF